MSTPSDITAQKLTRDFYLQKDVVAVSRQLLGKYLVTNFDGTLTAGQIVETEAYDGLNDKASHAYGNTRTKRTETMFMMGGVAYVYLCYGIHSLFNVITAPEDIPHAVLIRALEPSEGLDTMLERRGKDEVKPNLTGGPGCLAEALGITTDHDCQNLRGDQIWIEDRGTSIPRTRIKTGPRVGINYAEEDVNLPWRFWVRESKWVSSA